MTTRPLDEWLFRLNGDTPVLLGSRCGACQESFFPRRRICPICLAEVDGVDLPGSGTLYSHTFVRGKAAAWGKVYEDGYGVGEVDLAGGPRIQTVLRGEPGSWETGMPMQIDLEVVDSSSGDDLAMFCFRSAPGTARA
jgi:uncharacterized OB-fold protein